MIADLKNEIKCFYLTRKEIDFLKDGNPVDCEFIQNGQINSFKFKPKYMEKEFVTLKETNEEHISVSNQFVGYGILKIVDGYNIHIQCKGTHDDVSVFNTRQRKFVKGDVTFGYGATFYDLFCIKSHGHIFK